MLSNIPANKTNKPDTEMNQAKNPQKLMKRASLFINLSSKHDKLHTNLEYLEKLKKQAPLHVPNPTNDQGDTAKQNNVKSSPFGKLQTNTNLGMPSSPDKPRNIRRSILVLAGGPNQAQQFNRTLLTRLTMMAPSIKDLENQGKDVTALIQEELYQIRLKESIVDLKNEQDQKLVIEILNKKSRSNEEREFLEKAISQINFFKAGEVKGALSSKSANQLLFKSLRYVKFPRYHVIFNQGDHGNEFFIIIRGSVWTLQRRYKSDKQDQNQDANQLGGQSDLNEDTFSSALVKNETDLDFLKKYYSNYNLVHVFNAGGAFGEIALITNQPRTATMVCQQETEFMVLNKEAFINVIGKYYEQSKKEEMSFLKQYSFFNKMANAKMLSFMNDFEIQVYHPKSIVYSKNDLANKVYFIRKGEVEIEQVEEIGSQINQEILSKQTLQQQIKFKNQLHSMNASQKQKQQLLNKIKIPIVRQGANTFFGDYEIVNKMEYRQQTVVCTQQTQLFVINKKNLQRCLFQHNSYGVFIQEASEKQKLHNERKSQIIKSKVQNSSVKTDLKFEDFLQTKSVDQQSLIDFAPQSSTEVIIMENQKRKSRKEHIKQNSENIFNYYPPSQPSSQEKFNDYGQRTPNSVSENHLTTAPHITLNFDMSSTPHSKFMSVDTCKSSGTILQKFDQVVEDKSFQQPSSPKTGSNLSKYAKDYSEFRQTQFLQQPRVKESSQSTRNSAYNLSQMKQSTQGYKDEVDTNLMKRFKLTSNDQCSMIPKYWFSEINSKTSYAKTRHQSCQNILSHCTNENQFQSQSKQISHNSQRMQSITSQRGSARSNYLKSVGSNDDLLQNLQQNTQYPSSDDDQLLYIHQLKQYSSPQYHQHNSKELQNTILALIKDRAQKDIDTKLKQFNYYRQVLQLDKVWQMQLKKNNEIFQIPNQMIQKLKSQQKFMKKSKSISTQQKKRFNQFQEGNSYINVKIYNQRQALKQQKVNITIQQ